MWTTLAWVGVIILSFTVAALIMSGMLFTYWKFFKN
jgi:hypothetical protein